MYSATVLMWPQEQWKSNTESGLIACELLLLLWIVLSGILTLLSLFGLDELGPHVGPYDVRAPKVAHPEHETELVVSQRDDSVFGENQRLGSFVGLWDFHKHTADLDGGEEGEWTGGTEMERVQAQIKWVQKDVNRKNRWDQVNRWI